MRKVPRYYGDMNINDTVVKTPDKDSHLHLTQGFITAFLYSPYQIATSSWVCFSFVK